LALAGGDHRRGENLVGEPPDGVFERNERRRGVDAVDCAAWRELGVAQSVERLDHVRRQSDAAQLADRVAREPLAEAEERFAIGDIGQGEGALYRRHSQLRDDEL
jgi:hypothetical protein